MWVEMAPVDELAKHFKMGHSSASLPIHKGQDGERSCQYETQYSLVHPPYGAKFSVIHFFCIGLVVSAIGTCLWIDQFRAALPDHALSLKKIVSLVSNTMSPSSVRAWTTFVLSFSGSVAASVAWDRALVPAIRESTGSYTGRTLSAARALQTWYDADEGLWNSTGWWNSANCLTVLGDFYTVDAGGADDLGLNDVFSNTLIQAQKTTSDARKMFVTTATGLRIVESQYSTRPATGISDLAERGFSGFINNYYDDEGWWALAWIRAYDVTGNKAYLSMAESIFQDMQGGVNATCGGGIWWSKDRQYKNAIANELYLSVAASLANRASNRSSYRRIAEGQWEWFRNSGMIGSDNLINDGLTILANGTCVNNQENVWSYNQGVVLGGLVELYKANGKSSLLSQAVTIAEAAIEALSVDGILHESCEDDGCGADGSQFKGTRSSPVFDYCPQIANHVSKGVFMRNLHYLQIEVDQVEFRNFILDNANSIWANDRNSSNYLGLDWAGPPSAGGSPNASTQSSAMDTLVAAMAVM